MAPHRRRMAASATHYRQRKTTVEEDGTISQSNRTLSAPAVVQDKAQNIQLSQARHQAMSESEQSLLQDIALGQAPREMDDEDVHMDYTEVINGEEPLMISNAGGELEALRPPGEAGPVYQIDGGFYKFKRRRVDHRTRRDRNERRNRAFQAMIEALADAYMQWDYTQKHGHTSVEQELGDNSQPLRVLDLFETRYTSCIYPSADGGPAPRIVKDGAIPTAPKNPSVAISTKVLELYRSAHFRCPQLSIQAFVKTILDVQTTVYQKHLCRQFSIAYDLYLSIRNAVNSRVKRALGRDGPNWELLHNCPACFNELEEDQPMKYSILWATDGNDSLKRLDRREPVIEKGVLGASVESIDTRKVRGDFYLSRADVDRWIPANRRLPEEEEADEQDSGCRERWKNLKREHTAKAWGCFAETGIFAGFCRHAFTLTLADMYRTGEQIKYFLAAAEKVMRVGPRNQLMCIDVGCRHKISMARSELAPLAEERGLVIGVDKFHCHAHNRLCQVHNLPTYLEGAGLEDFGVCERNFCKSNTLAASTRYMGEYRRRQSIAEHYRNMDDMENYMNMSKWYCPFVEAFTELTFAATFLLNNYKQALKILREVPVNLEIAKIELGLSHEENDVLFPRCLQEETDYLNNLPKEPPMETLQMELHQRLISLWRSESVNSFTSERLDLTTISLRKNLAAIQTVVFHMEDPGPSRRRDDTNTIETRRRHAIENCEKARSLVHALETQLGVVERWTVESTEFKDAERKVAMRQYQRALDHLEGLVVGRIFELNDMNRSQMGYKQRQHVGQALHARSGAIRNALVHYNTAAQNVVPPRQTLEFNEVIEWAFLSDFDLLRDARQDVRERPWATPTGRRAVDEYFHMLRAREEIIRCNNEARRIATHLRDESTFLHHHEEMHRSTNPLLAHQIAKYRQVRGRFDAHHKRQLQAISRLDGFSGSIELGHSLDIGPGAPASIMLDTIIPVRDTLENLPVRSQEEEELEIEQDDDDEAVQEADDMLDILAVAMDKVNMAGLTV
ncbi:hypothetical protein HWV62_15074 [Athelia sp. TMB]|nr:hypothetical protein HWV62_15074 [Athelia sp. TMB]